VNVPDIDVAVLPVTVNISVTDVSSPLAALKCMPLRLYGNASEFVDNKSKGIAQPLQTGPRGGPGLSVLMLLPDPPAPIVSVPEGKPQANGYTAARQPAMESFPGSLQLVIVIGPVQVPQLTICPLASQTSVGWVVFQ